MFESATNNTYEVDGKPYSGEHMHDVLNGMACDTNTIGLELLQDQLKFWSLYNFGHRTQIEPLLGMIEEVGETAGAWMQVSGAISNDISSLLCAQIWLSKAIHHQLKSMQGIRGTSEEHFEAKQKALTATFRYLNAAITQDGLLYQESLEQDSLPEVKDSIGDGLADSLVYHADFANALGIDLTTELDATWKKVRERDWVLRRAEAAKDPEASSSLGLSSL